MKFTDEGGNKVSFKWWRKWQIAKWHWRAWLRYEGMPAYYKEVEQFLEFEKKRAINSRRIGTLFGADILIATNDEQTFNMAFKFLVEATKPKHDDSFLDPR